MCLSHVQVSDHSLNYIHVLEGERRELLSKCGCRGRRGAGRIVEQKEDGGVDWSLQC